jgi:hypothetical protein
LHRRLKIRKSALFLAFSGAGNAPAALGHEEQAAYLDFSTAAGAKPKVLVIDPFEVFLQLAQLDFGSPKGCVVDAFVVDGVHAADSTDGIIGGNRPGGFLQILNVGFGLGNVRFDLLAYLASFFSSHGNVVEWESKSERLEGKNSINFKL